MPTPSSAHAARMAEAHNHMPQGVAENYRYWGDDKTVFVDSVDGCRILDCDGKQYIDFRLGYGPIILGYRDLRVDSRVIETIQDRGTISGFSAPLDVKVVKQIKQILEAAGVDYSDCSERHELEARLAQLRANPWAD